MVERCGHPGSNCRTIEGSTRVHYIDIAGSIRGEDYQLCTNCIFIIRYMGDYTIKLCEGSSTKLFPLEGYNDAYPVVKADTILI